MNDELIAILNSWLVLNQRDLPWRKTTDPYAIWISEVILQQTRVDQGIAYYQRFLEQWPDIASLAAAREQEVLKMWQGLGYYSRARNLLTAAKQIMSLHKGVFPEDPGKLRQLKGIGPYTAAAIASIAFGHHVAVVDGNVKRFLSRFYGLDLALDRGEGKRQLEKYAQSIVENGHPGLLNQVMMEFGALQCVPRNPLCNKCPLAEQCVALRQNLVQQLPVSIRKKASRNRYFNYLVMAQPHDDGLVFVVRKRIGNDIWKGMFEFPLIETANETDFGQLSQTVEFDKITAGQHFLLSGQPFRIRHILTHQNIFACFYLLIFDHLGFVEEKNNVFLMNQNRPDDYPLPRLIMKYLLSLENQN